MTFRLCSNFRAKTDWTVPRVAKVAVSGVATVWAAQMTIQGAIHLFSFNANAVRGPAGLVASVSLAAPWLMASMMVTAIFALATVALAKYTYDTYQEAYRPSIATRAWRRITNF